MQSMYNNPPAVTAQRSVETRGKLVVGWPKAMSKEQVRQIGLMVK
jgi:hypothetical protein